MIYNTTATLYLKNDDEPTTFGGDTEDIEFKTVKGSMCIYTALQYGSNNIDATENTYTFITPFKLDYKTDMYFIINKKRYEITSIAPNRHNVQLIIRAVQ